VNVFCDIITLDPSNPNVLTLFEITDIACEITRHLLGNQLALSRLNFIYTIFTATIGSCSWCRSAVQESRSSQTCDGMHM